MTAALSDCPINGRPGKVVKLITLKALLIPGALMRLAPDDTYHFCADPACPVVYYGASGNYRIEELKIPVFQKDSGSHVPVCYCFAYSRCDLEHAARSEDAERIPRVIRGHIQAGRCGCEVNSPQGSCCLGNVTRMINTIREDEAASSPDCSNLTA